jgi:ribonuclease-3
MSRRPRAGGKPSAEGAIAAAPAASSELAEAGPDVLPPPALQPAAPAKKASPVPGAAPKPRAPSRRRTRIVSGLESRIGYRFKDLKLIDCALTHISAMTGPRNPAGSYQRLEFLGDHVLGLVVSDMLFQAFPKANEGDLSRRLADLVRKETCAEVARGIDLGAAIKLGASEVSEGGRQRVAILGDVCEALIGAVYLDGGYPAAEALVKNLWDERMRKTDRPPRDPKTMLQEWAQARGLPTPAYREVERTGPHHDPEFRIAVQLPDREPAEGLGRSKRAAEQAAAAAMLLREGVEAGWSHG